MQFISVMQSWIFSIITPVFKLQFYIWSALLLCRFAAKETFLIIIIAAKIVVE